jgi:hypothetical protein
VEKGLGESYEASHARLVVEAFTSIFDRRKLISEAKIKLLPPESQSASDKIYFETAEKLLKGIESIIRSYEKSTSPLYKKIFEIYQSIKSEYPG